MANLKNTTINDTGYIQFPVGTTAQRPASPVNGDMRFNSEFKVPETYVDGAWKYMPPIVESGLVLYLDAAEPASYPGSGTTWYDLSGNGNNVTLINGVNYDTNTKSFVFDGVNDYGVTSNNVILSSTDKITVNVIFRTNSTTTMLLEHSTNWNTNNAFGLLVGPDLNVPSGKAELADHTSSYNVAYTNTTINDNNWYSFCVTSDRSLDANTQIITYLNGINDTIQRINNVDISGNYSSFPIYIGSRAGSSLFFSGNIASILLYNRALSQSEITQNFNALRGRYGI